MKRAVVLTIYDPHPNMGNRLQNYAVQKILSKMNLDVVSISFLKGDCSLKWKIKYGINKLTGYRFTKRKVYWKKLSRRYKEFVRFNKKYIKTCHVNGVEQIPEADYYVLGSDQIWNPLWWNRQDSYTEKMVYLAAFSEPDKIVCISPSFGCENLPEEWKPYFKEKLDRIPKLCVREDTGKKIIKELTGKDAIVTIDPTLMLSRNEWDEIAEKPQNFNENENYILTYFLGGISERAEKDLRSYSQQLNSKIYKIFDESCEFLYGASPSNFIYLIKNAKLVVTDSFHACVFSFIYDKPFLVYNREGASDMMSRMETLFEKFDLKRKYVDSGLENNIIECDYSVGKENLAKEKKLLEVFIEKQIRL